MSAVKHTPGPWVSTGAHVDGQDGETIATITQYKRPTPRQEANARLIAAAPELRALAYNFEITGPDADGLVWLVLHGKGTTCKAMFNLGAADRVAAQVALLHEQDRRAAIAKTAGSV